MNKREATQHIRAVVVAVPPDDPAQVVHVALALHRHDYFEVSIVGCAPRSSLEALASVPVVAGGLMSGIGAGRLIDRAREATKRLRENIAEALAVLPEDDRPPLGHIEGAYLDIITRLSCTFDLVVVPHPIEVPDVLGLWFPNFDICLMLSKAAPTLFGTRPWGWQSIIIAQIGGHQAWWATEILRRISGPLGVSVHQWLPGDRAHVRSQPSGVKNALLPPGCDDIGQRDVATIPAEQQSDVCLVIPARVLRSIFRFRKVRHVLRGWQGSCLVWP